MVQKYKNFIHGVSVNRYGKTGVILTTSSFITFLILEFARLIGIFTNAYIGLVTYLLLPTLFILGLILIPVGWYSRKKTTGKSTKELLDEQFEKNDLENKFIGTRVFRTILIFTVLNVVFLLSASSRMMIFMDESEFCGTACHSVMNPEWTTYQQSPHSRVNCVDCHVGEGVDALISSKLNGVWQMVSVSFNLYEKPIPTPVHQLRPSRETCEKCHWPDKFYGSKLKMITRYQRDESSSPKYTTLNLKIDTGLRGQKSGIHWHISEQNKVFYTSLEDKRLDISSVEVHKADGTIKRYRNRELTEFVENNSDLREMDCVDCHNRATHIYEDPEVAIDDRISSGLLDRSLPYTKREGLAALTSRYKDKKSGFKALEDHMHAYYRENYSKKHGSMSTRIEGNVKTLQDIYDRNIHQGMNIHWGSYPNHIGHRKGKGCFRCHNSSLIDEQENGISEDCTLCHSILANEENEPFKYLLSSDKKERNYKMHNFLKDEFLNQWTK